jgi:hypothetical protein
VAALGLGLASTIPGRSPLIDGFGLIAFASLFPIIAVMAYAQLSEAKARRAHNKLEKRNKLKQELKDKRNLNRNNKTL